MISLPIRGHAVATLHAYAEEDILTPDDRADPDMIGVCAAVDAYIRGDRERLVFPASAALDVADGLNDLANGEDDQADATRRSNPEFSTMCRAARDGLQGLRRRVLARAS